RLQVQVGVAHGRLRLRRERLRDRILADGLTQLRRGRRTEEGPEARVLRVELGDLHLLLVALGLRQVEACELLKRRRGARPEADVARERADRIVGTTLPLVGPGELEVRGRVVGVLLDLRLRLANRRAGRATSEVEVAAQQVADPRGARADAEEDEA